ncbi:MAG: hypothetical protein KatS3mg058_2616 [Roseiflexus sp.]|nr:MAG: hypothetical protein KatS3mg058_2616 [Roseiflexus sp.]
MSARDRTRIGADGFFRSVGIRLDPWRSVCFINRTRMQRIGADGFFRSVGIRLDPWRSVCSINRTRMHADATGWHGWVLPIRGHPSRSVAIRVPSHPPHVQDRKTRKPRQEPGPPGEGGEERVIPSIRYMLKFRYLPLVLFWHSAYGDDGSCSQTHCFLTTITVIVYTPDIPSNA